MQESFVLTQRSLETPVIFSWLEPKWSIEKKSLNVIMVNIPNAPWIYFVEKNRQITINTKRLDYVFPLSQVVLPREY